MKTRILGAYLGLACASFALTVNAFAALTPAQVIKTLKLDAMNESAPDFEYVNAEGKKHQLSELKGKPVVIHFWASWCTSCAKELPLLQSATQKWAKDAIVFLPVSVEGLEKKNENISFLAKNAPGTPYLVPTETKSVHSYWAWGLPATYFINARGKLIARSLGARDWNAVAADEVKDLLELK